MPRKNNRDRRMDPREKRFLAGDPPELIEKPKHRKGKWRDHDDLFWTEPLDEEDDDG